MPDPTPKKKLPAELKSLARSYTDLSLQAIAEVIQNGESEAARVSAAFGMLDRGWGKPQQDQTHEIKGEIKVTLRKMLEDDE